MDRARVAILVSGRGSNMAALLYAARATDCPYEVALVTGDKPDAAGLAVAEAEKVPVKRLDSKALGKGYWEALQSALEAAAVDFIALAGFMKILPADFVARWSGQIVNIHPSLLPKYKGLHTHQTAIDNGDAKTGATVHVVTPEVDSGEILGQVEVAIMPGDNAESLEARVLIAEHQLYPKILAEYVSRPFDARWIEAKIDSLAGGFAEVGRKTSHGSPGWSVGAEKSGKLFAIIADRHHGEDAVGLLVKASGPDEMAGLIEAQPDVYYWPKYYGASGWLGIKLNRRDVDWDQVADWLERSWRACAPKRLARMMDIADEF
ncbi:phosphoribosylglycinamide formyltransferase [Sphingomonas sp. HDW15A]|uniref:phosphoribosylglycinamide formyltransferase n=1 Tax=Sphingomonas sp. HDW15A TaxID=2714942 RepID=UPI0014075FBF|nr:phosphoribosylglycinamide formyltransferase [Sphingomonas sp. HDW15A]QIK96155.1 phosphoribosylglycinamide formyltransferase [Sphingomonas sp. HDW15A]